MNLRKVGILCPRYGGWQYEQAEGNQDIFFHALCFVFSFQSFGIAFLFTLIISDCKGKEKN